MSSPDKHFISAQELLEDSVELGRQVLESGFRPNFIVGVWRGGTPVGIAVQELLDFFGVKTDHISIRTSSYDGMSRKEAAVRVHGLSYLTRAMNADDSLLIVDDVFDTGLSVQAIVNKLKKRARLNLPHDIRIATAYYKPARNKSDLVPDYYAHESDRWLVFPHEMHGLSSAELRQHKPYLTAALDQLEGKMNRRSG
ncbi:MAG: hypoxanthine phosphoribosyltransferase [Gammaproteobacteria bacterium]|nr:hypoxanthine phosphoribosyltransferase [Gammaproteobacteria bacterium]